MSRDRETTLITQLRSRCEVSSDLKLMLELFNIRLERRKDSLVNEEEDNSRASVIRGQAKELRELIKSLSTKALDTTNELG